jgi:hypothetical protein
MKEIFVCVFELNTISGGPSVGGGSGSNPNPSIKVKKRVYGLRRMRGNYRVVAHFRETTFLQTFVNLLRNFAKNCRNFVSRNFFTALKETLKQCCGAGAGAGAA